MNKKRALIVGSGALKGSYDAGVACALCRELGHDYFDAVYGCSAGAYTVSFFVANQPDEMEDVWRHYLHDGALLGFLKPLEGKTILDLDYLIKILEKSPIHLNVDAVVGSKTYVNYVVTSLTTGLAEYKKPNVDNLFRYLYASSAVPLLTHKVLLDNKEYIDGGLSDPLPVEKALIDGYDEVVVISHRLGDNYSNEHHNFGMDVYGHLLPDTVSNFVKIEDVYYSRIKELCNNDSRIKRIVPQKELALSGFLDDDREDMNICVDQGIADAYEFLKDYQRN